MGSATRWADTSAGGPNNVSKEHQLLNRRTPHHHRILYCAGTDGVQVEEFLHGGSIVYSVLPLTLTSHGECNGGGMSSRLKMRTTWSTAGPQ